MAFYVNIINLSIKLDTFPLKCKIAKIKTLFKKGIKTEANNYTTLSLLPLISKVIQKNQFMLKYNVVFKELDCCIFINQALE